jgi:ribonuclease PH
VLCTASVEEKVPPHKRGSGEGWVTAEYGMLPRATHTRSDREAATRQAERPHAGDPAPDRPRCARVRPGGLGERTIHLDCDVLQADGGTRTAAITGAFVAAHDAVSWLMAGQADRRVADPRPVAAVSVGIVQGTPLLDLEYTEDSACDTDMNVVMTGAGGFVEVQGTAEGARSRAPRWTAAGAGRQGHPRAGRAPAAPGAGRAAEMRWRLICMKIVLASNNAGKLAELQAMLAPLGVELVRQGDLGIPRPTSPSTPSSRTRWPRRAMRPAPAACRRWPTTPACASTPSAACPAWTRPYYATQFGYEKGDANNVRALLEQMQGIDNRRAAMVSTLVACAVPTTPSR